MSDVDDWDEEKFTELEIPLLALPVLRDLGIHFIALIEFDLFLGPVVTLKEIRPGSTFIHQLYDIRKLSEVYAGLARTNLDSIGIADKFQGEQIAVARIDPGGDEDITSVILISCQLDKNVEEVQDLADRIIQKSGGLSDNITLALQEAVKEVVDKISTSYKSKSQTKTTIELKIEDRPMKSLGLNYVNGYFLVDLKNRSADFRNLPVWVNGKNFDPKEVMEILDKQFDEIEEKEVATLFIKSIPFLGTKIVGKEIYTFLLLEDTGLRVANSISNWYYTLSEVISEEWKQANRNEIHNILSYLDESTFRSIPLERVAQVARILIRSNRIKPITKSGVEIEFENQIPTFIAGQYWNALKHLDGKLTISEISENWVERVINVVMILEWARTRNLIVLVQ
jgi:hypothetical protein